MFGDKPQKSLGIIPKLLSLFRRNASKWAIDKIKKMAYNLITR